MKTIKSDFQNILPEDSKQFREISERYIHLNSEDGIEAYDLMKQSWSLAQRWSELQASASKIANIDNAEINKTDFKTWAYQRYRQERMKILLKKRMNGFGVSEAITPNGLVVWVCAALKICKTMIRVTNIKIPSDGNR